MLAMLLPMTFPTVIFRVTRHRGDDAREDLRAPRCHRRPPSTRSRASVIPRRRASCDAPRTSHSAPMVKEDEAHDGEAEGQTESAQACLHFHGDRRGLLRHRAVAADRLTALGTVAIPGTSLDAHAAVGRSCRSVHVSLNRLRSRSVTAPPSISSVKPWQHGIVCLSVPSHDHPAKRVGALKLGRAQRSRHSAAFHWWLRSGREIALADGHPVDPHLVPPERFHAPAVDVRSVEKRANDGSPDAAVGRSLAASAGLDRALD